MSLAYIILAHTLPDQLARLVSALHHPDDLFLIHVDAKAPSEPFRAALEAGPGRAPNIEYLDPIRCDWGAFSLVEAPFRGIERALQSGGRFSHVLLLSGQDYPIKPLDRIRAHFDAHHGRSFMSWSAGDPASDGMDRRGNRQWVWNGNRYRLEYRWFLLGGTWRHLPNRYLPFFPYRRRLPLDLRPYQGNQFWNLSIEAAGYVRDFAAENPSVMRFFRKTLASDEFFFQTLMMNSPLAESVVNEDLRYMTWDAEHPLTLGADDLEDMKVSEKLFARKFDATKDAGVLDLIDETLR